MAARKKSASSKKKAAKRSPAKSAKRKVATKATKASVKRATAKRATKQADVAKKSGPVSVGRKPFSKSQFIAEISAQAGVARRDAVAVLDAVSKIIAAHLQKSGPELFSWPGLLKIKVIKKPATKARQGINPFTGEPMMFKAKPASRKVKVLALKKLKEMAA